MQRDRRERRFAIAYWHKYQIIRWIETDNSRNYRHRRRREPPARKMWKCYATRSPSFLFLFCYYYFLVYSEKPLWSSIVSRGVARGVVLVVQSSSCSNWRPANGSLLCLWRVSSLQISNYYILRLFYYFVELGDISPSQGESSSTPSNTANEVK